MTPVSECDSHMTNTRPLRLGLIINPLAGLGGPLALKGSDDTDLLGRAQALDGEHRAQSRMRRALTALGEFPGRFTLLGFAGEMGEQVALDLGLAYTTVGSPTDLLSTAADTRKAATALCAAGVDIIVFAGGDGTARDIADVVGVSVPVLGVPAGVKMHSGVFAINPEAAALVLRQLLLDHWAPLREAEVRDIDEEAFRQGKVRTRHYADMRVPEVPQAMQVTKTTGQVPDALAQLEVAAGCIEQMDEQTLYLVGPGSTTQTLLQELGLPATLLGVDVLQGRQLRLADASASDIEALLASHTGAVGIIVTAIGGQGHVFGRGNQQLTPAVIRRAGRSGIQIIATSDKLRALAGRPLLLDTHDATLDQELAGLYPVITGYRERLLYPVGVLPEELP